MNADAFVKDLLRLLVDHGFTDAMSPELIQALTSRKRKPKEEIPEEPEGADEITAIWNKHKGERLTQALPARGNRRRLANGRWKEHPNVDFWRNAVERVAASNFCCGESESKWRANFDWLIRPGTVENIYEGKYDNRLAARAPSSVAPNGPLYKAD
jgi:hypothetical protein